MKIQFSIPQNGYKPELTHARETGTFNDWVEAKYVPWISEAISTDFVIVTISDNKELSGFIVDFVYEDDGRDFLAKLGGRVVE
ncbi:hypothetical protein [Sinorhizobium psoraleae]|uniref:Uncharacterized protein n=1 Tax=Sinorhizobium psoraleae TaxID=520838 RepID=A0ABT4KB59_9HYPH|nr:hypothetical protein [Sinorhizobium psoraleae]MCZ4089084.1 hypothetical protein [Sinorhizobium psoraleae]